MQKFCTKCKELKDIYWFGRDAKSKDGYSWNCKACIKEYISKYKDARKKYYKEYYKRNIEKRKNYEKERYENRKEELKNYQKEYSLKNKTKVSERSKKYYRNNKDKIKEKQKIWILNNKDKINKTKRNYIKSDNFKTSRLISNRIRCAIRAVGTKKYFSSNELLGCSIEFFRNYIETKFRPQMTWQNHGLNGWHLDHIMPCSSFNLNDPNQQKLCFHYTNMQPLWATTAIAIKNGESSEYIGNLEKSNKINI